MSGTLYGQGLMAGNKSSFIYNPVHEAADLNELTREGNWYILDITSPNLPVMEEGFLAVRKTWDGRRWVQHFHSISNTHYSRVMDISQNTWSEWKGEAQTGSGGGFDAGTRILFQQAAAPTGWTRDTNAALNDSALRLVTTSAPTGGGANGFVSRMAGSVSITGSVGNTTLAEWQMPWHSHYTTIIRECFIRGTNAGFGDELMDGMNDLWSSATGGNGAHNHSLTINSLNLNVKYVDLILASKD